MNSYLAGYTGRSRSQYGLDERDRNTILVGTGIAASGIAFYLWTDFNPLLFLVPGGWKEWKLARVQSQLEKLRAQGPEQQEQGRDFSPQQWRMMHKFMAEIKALDLDSLPPQEAQRIRDEKWQELNERLDSADRDREEFEEKLAKRWAKTQTPPQEKP